MRFLIHIFCDSKTKQLIINHIYLLQLLAMSMSRIPPGRAGQNITNPPGRGGQAGIPKQSFPPPPQRQQQQQQQQRVKIPALTIAGFSRKPSNSTTTKNVLIDSTSPQFSQVQPQPVSYSQSIGERRIVKLTAEQERQQLRQWQDQQRIMESARAKDREIEQNKANQRERLQKPTVNLKPHPFTPEQSLYFEERNKRRTQVVDAISLNIIHKIFGNATTKVKGQIIPYQPGPVDLTVEPDLLNPSNPNSYNFWITNISSGLIKRLTGLVVRGLYAEEAASSFIQLESPKNGINLALMVRDDRYLWGYISLVPSTDGLKFVLIYQLPVPLDWNDDGNEMKYQYSALNEAYNTMLNNMMMMDE
jgi:hypothetical protein